MSTLNFVTVSGNQWKPSGYSAPKKAAKPQKEKFHKGFRVVGLPPGLLERAQVKHEKERRDKKEPKPFSRDAWLASAAAKPVRAKPYEVKDAAYQCTELARKAGWLRVEVVELKQE